MQQMGYSASCHPHERSEVLRFRLMLQRGLGRTSHKHQWEKRSMKHYAGLDVSVKETSLCILDEMGKVCCELKVTSHPDDLVQVLQDPAWRLERVGLEAGPLSQWLYSGLAMAGLPDLAEVIACLLAARQSLRECFATLHRKVLAMVRDDDVCRRLMTIPGVGPVVSLAFSATIDIPARFKNSKAVGPALGLTPVLNQSGESNRIGRVSCGAAMLRALLYEAAQVLLARVQKWSWLKAWAVNVARRRGLQKAIVALARRLAVIMHRLWSDDTEFRWTREDAVATA
jgi:hypothetical protein